MIVIYLVMFIALTYNAYLMGKCAAHVLHIMNGMRNG